MIIAVMAATEDAIDEDGDITEIEEGFIEHR